MSMLLSENKSIREMSSVKYNSNPVAETLLQTSVSNTFFRYSQLIDKAFQNSGIKLGRHRM